MILEIKCPHCNEKIDLDFSNAETETWSNERSMGPETTTNYILSEVPCPKCNGKIMAVFTEMEYPIGVISHQELNTGKIE